MQLLMTELLGLSGIEVENYTDCDNTWILDIEARTTEARCPRCEQISCHLHQNHGYLARELSISRRTVFLKVNRRQFKCATSGIPLAVRRLISWVIVANRRIDLPKKH